MSQPDPATLQPFLDELDAFIARELAPLEAEGDNRRFFDHRREYARTDWDDNGKPHPAWEALLGEARRRAREAGFLGFALPAEYGGGDASN
jgi:acyl-CoA dehydrogenase